jgi:ribose 1,5-bisphosphate isomerase
MSIRETAEKIQRMEIRGAGKIARAAAQALKDFVMECDELDKTKFISALNQAKETLANTRPTAVSLANALEATINGAHGDTVSDLRAGVISAAETFISNSESAIEKIAELCAGEIKDGYTIMTHCNSTVAVNSIKKAHDQGKKISVFATETRPWRQGFITARALADAGVDITLIVDSAVRHFMSQVNLVIIGADTITVNGDVINKIGTSQIAACGHEFGVPVLVCAETYKFAKFYPNGDSVPIEERDISEIDPAGQLIGVKIRNPVFDVTPSKYVSFIISEVGIITPDKVVKIVE